MTTLRRLLVAVLFTLSFAIFHGAPFTPGNLVLSRAGSGTGSLVNTGNPVFLDEYTTAGVFVQSIALPTVASGANRAFYLSGTATSEGFLSRSADGNYLVLAGYAATGTGLTTSSGGTVNRVVARVDASGAIDTTTALSSFATGGNPRSAATVDGTAFWLAGSSNGEHYALLGATTSTVISNTITNLRVTQIFNNQLYVSDASGAVRLGAIGTGVPTTGSQALVNLPGFPTSGGSPYGYFFADLNAGVAGLDTLYVADDGGTIAKYSLVGTNWTANGTVTAAAVRGLTGSVSGSTVTLYGVTGASGGAGSSKLYKFTDSTGYNATVSGTATTIFTDVANTAFRGIAFAPGGGGGGGAIPPTVTTTAPVDDAINISPASSIMITFNAPATVTGTWFTIDGSISGSHTATYAPVGSTFTLVPSPAFAEGENVMVNVIGTQVTDALTGTASMAADYPFSFTTQTFAPLPIHTIQGSGTTSPYAGQGVTVEGIVTATFQGSPGLGGFYIQAAEADYDADPATSEGIFVFTNTFPVSVGQAVRVSGSVLEFGTAPKTQTELTSVTSVIVLSSGNPLPAPVSLSLPFPNLDLERYECMRVTFPQTLTVTNTYVSGNYLAHFGEFTLSNGVLNTPTNVVSPGAPAAALDAANQLNQILIDDGVSTAYPDPTPYLADSGGLGLTRRTGSTTTTLSGIFDERFNFWIVEPTSITFADTNPRSAPPTVSGTLKVTIGNVLNFFNGNGSGAADPTAAGFLPRTHQRGADTQAEFVRQRAKIIAGIIALAPDIMGLTEVENDRVTNVLPNSYGSTSAIFDLVSGLNDAAPAGTTYAFVDASAVDIVTDDIHCAFIYRTQTVAPVGTPKMLNDPSFNSVARNPLAQTFQQLSNGEKLTVCINHFKSKGSAASYPSTALNADQNDGQSASNYVRVLQANALTAWLATDPTGSGDPDFLIIGDLNAYAKEDPIVAIENAGYINLTEAAEGVGGYSYAFGGGVGHLDHALANGHLAGQVVDARTWHVNSDEPAFYDYNITDVGYTKTAGQQAVNATGPYRYSDHDPVAVGLNLHADPAPDVTGQLTITKSTLVKNLVTKRYTQVFTVKNTSATPLSSQVTIIIAGLSPNATLYNPAGFTTVVTPVGSPYFNLNVGADNLLTPGESVTYTVEFINPTNAPISYTVKAVAGAGAR